MNRKENLALYSQDKGHREEHQAILKELRLLRRQNRQLIGRIISLEKALWEAEFGKAWP